MITLLHLAPHSAPVTYLTSRILLTLLVVGVIALSLWGMRRAWLAKSRQFRDLPQPASAVPHGSVATTEPFEARFAGSTVSGQWLNRITVHALGTPRSVVAMVHDDGIVITDDADFTLWISRTAISTIHTGRGIAGDVVEPDGMVIVTWTLGEQLIDTGLRISRHEEHDIFIQAARELMKENA